LDSDSDVLAQLFRDLPTPNGVVVESSQLAELSQCPAAASAIAA
jgi:hypothetical protein